MPVVAHALLFAADVTLGSPRRIVYPYSPVAWLRLISVCRAFSLLVPLAAGVLLAGSDRRGRRRLGLALFAAAYAGLVSWTFVGNPLGMPEHQFNMVSPSQDGAFLIEARSIDSAAEYLRSYPELTRRSSDALRGVRVLSNPPGTTLLGVAICTLNRETPGLFERIERVVIGDEKGVDDPNREIAEGALMAAVLTALWGSSIVFAYGLARLWWGPAVSLVVALACVFSPSSVLFTPGKDPAQLFTTLAMLFFWFRAYVRGGRISAVFAGAAFVIGTMVGLVHIWVAGIAVGATLWHTIPCAKGPAGSEPVHVFGARPSVFDFGSRCVVPAAVGAFAVTAASYLLWGWNIPATAWATARRYMEVQHDVLISPFYFNLIGGGVFLLFLGPTFWVLAARVCHRRPCDEPARLGGRVLLLTVAVMLYTYFFAQNAEVGRLWVVFVPLLIWPVALVAFDPANPSRTGGTTDTRRPPSRGLQPARSAEHPQSPRTRRDTLLVALIVCQVAGTMLQWSMMDARGTESRILSGRHFADEQPARP